MFIQKSVNILMFISNRKKNNEIENVEKENLVKLKNQIIFLSANERKPDALFGFS